MNGTKRPEMYSTVSDRQCSRTAVPHSGLFRVLKKFLYRRKQNIYLHLHQLAEKIGNYVLFLVSTSHQ